MNRFIPTLIAAAVALLPTITFAADELDRYELVLEHASLDGAKDAQVTLLARGGRVARIYAATANGKGRVFGTGSPDYLHIPPMYKQIGDGFVADGSTLKGSFTILAWNGNRDIWEQAFSLDVKVNAVDVEGTYSALLATTAYRGYQEGYDSTDRPAELVTKEVAGTVTGKRLTETYLRQNNWVSPEKSWPCYQGPYGNFVATVSTPALQLIDDPAQARQVWMSEEIIPVAASAVEGYGMRFTPLPNGGAAGPVVANGYVYLYYYCGVGPLGKCTSRDGPPPSLRFDDAHDIVLCIDAASGKTAWKQVFANKGLTAMPHKTELANNTPVVADGRVYAMGSAAMLYCMDAATGTVIWERGYPGQYESLTKLKNDRLAGTTCNAVSGRSGGHALSYAGGVLVACPLGNSTSLAAFDGATGDQLWSRGKAINGEGTPTRWSNGGKEYVVSCGPDTIFCFEPRTGAVLWQQYHQAMFKQAVLNEDYLVVRDTAEFVCYRITPTSITRLWSVDEGGGNNNDVVAGVIMGDKAYLRADGISVFELASGTKLASVPALTSSQECNVWASDSRIYVSMDEQHGKLYPYLVDADPANFRQLGAQWWPDIPMTTGYEIPFVNPIVDGRMYIRTADAIQCWDLRKPGSVAALPSAGRGKPVGAALRANGRGARATRVYDLRGRPLPEGLTARCVPTILVAGSRGQIVRLTVRGR